MGMNALTDLFSSAEGTKFCRVITVDTAHLKTIENIEHQKMIPCAWLQKMMKHKPT